MKEEDSKPSIAILVHACDRYNLLFKGFEFFFKKYWDNSIGYNVYFTFELNEFSFSDFQTIQTGEGSWTRRLAKALEQIEEEYIIFFQEDFWLKMPTQSSFFKELFSYVNEHKLNLIKLHSSTNYVREKQVATIGSYQLYELDKLKSKFLLSHQISLWNKKFLLQQLERNETAWQNEIWGTKRIKKRNTAIYLINYFEYDDYKIPNPGSKYYTISREGKLNDNIEYFLNELSGEKELSKYYQKLCEHYKNSWTHDKGANPYRFSLWDRIRLKFKL